MSVGTIHIWLCSQRLMASISVRHASKAKKQSFEIAALGISGFWVRRLLEGCILMKFPDLGQLRGNS